MKKQMDIEKELSKVIVKCLLNEGHDPKAVAFVVSKYDLTSYLLDEPLRIMSEQAEAVSKAMAV